MMKKGLSLVLAMLMLLSVVACSETDENETKGNDPALSESESDTESEETELPETEPEETEWIDRFEGVDYDGRSFRIYTSVYTGDSTNADALIRGSGETNGDAVNDAVYIRNEEAANRLDVKLDFYEANFYTESVLTELNNMILSGIDAYDVVVNDVYALAGMSVDGRLHTVAGTDILDLSASYWNEDAMRDLQLVDEGLYCLIGDYFTDTIQSCHVLYVNEDLLESVAGDSEYVNKLVFDGQWTIDAMMEVDALAVKDTDGDGEMTEGDRFGFTCIGTWGSGIPVLIGTGIEFISREDGEISYCFNNERSVAILEKMNELFWNESTLKSISDWSPAGLRNLFARELTLIMGYNRLGDLANLRDVEFTVGVIPYPKLDLDQENYVSSMHDSTEIGAIPVTVPVSELDFVFTCLEVLSEETSKTLIPEYYENALKFKYVNDAEDAKMVDLIHASIGSPFGVAFSANLNDFLLKTCFYNLLKDHKTDFSSAYQQNQKAANKVLKSLVSKAQASVEQAREAGLIK